MNMINKSVGGGKNNDGRTESPKQQKVDTETPQQKQAAAKLALRKQLEKTLLQVREQNRFTTCFKNCETNCWVFHKDLKKVQTDIL